MADARDTALPPTVTRTSDLPGVPARTPYRSDDMDAWFGTEALRVDAIMAATGWPRAAVMLISLLELDLQCCEDSLAIARGDDGRAVA